MKRAVIVSAIVAAGVSLGCNDNHHTMTSPSVLSVTSITPTFASAGGTVDIRITGTGFQAGASVSVDGPATNVMVVSGELIKATTPVHAAGQVDVVVTNPDGQSARLPRALTFANVAVSGLMPNIGSAGASVTISGIGFRTGATVTFGDAPANVVSLTSVAINVVVPDHAYGAVDIVVTNPDGQVGAATRAFTFASLFVTDLTRRSGLVGDFLRILGSGFRPGATVTFGGQPAITLPNNPGTEMWAFAPAHGNGPVDVVVTNPDGESSTLIAAFTYLSVSVSASSTQVVAGGPLSVSWSAPTGRDPGDVVALFKVGDANTDFVWVASTQGKVTGTLTLLAPAQPGQYEFRYLVDELFTDAARSSVITVSAAPSATSAILSLSDAPRPQTPRVARRSARRLRSGLRPDTSRIHA